MAEVLAVAVALVERAAWVEVEVEAPRATGGGTDWTSCGSN